MPIDMQALSKDPDFQKLSPAEQRDLMATAYQRNQAEQPAPAPEVPSPYGPQHPSHWEALKGAFTGTQRLPFQAGAPEEGMDPVALGETASRESTAGKVISGITGAVTSPSSIGELVGTTFVPGPLKPLAGAGGAMIGEGYRQWKAGEPFSPAGIMREGIASAVPEVLESAGRAVLRTASRGTSTGKTLMREEGARQGRQVPEDVFQPKPAAEIGQSFEKVRATGMKIDTADIGTHLNTLSPGKQADVLSELTQLDRANRTGGRYATLYKDISAGSLSGADIGTLQDFRSQLRQRADALKKYPESQKLVKDLQDAVDDAIDTGFTAGVSQAQSQATRDLLHSAWQDWARSSAADDMRDMIENKIRSGQDLSTVSFNLAGFYDELRRGRSEISKSVDRAMDVTPGARERFDTAIADVAKNYQYVNLPKIPGMEQALSYMMLSPTMREALSGAIVQGRGTVSPNTMALLVNAATREMGIGRTRRTIESESASGPGGPARMTD